MSAAGARRLLMVEQGGRGGVSDYTAELVAALAAEGWAVTLATAADHRYRPVQGVTVVPVFHYTRGDTRFARALRERGLGKLANGLRFLAALPRLTALARGAEVVHSQGWEVPQLGPLALACLRATGRPVVQTEHGTFDRAQDRLFGTAPLARRLSGRLAARTIVHTQADLDRVPPLLRGRVRVIPHGEYGGLARSGGTAERERARAALGLAADVPVTLMFGQLRSDKGLDDLAQAVAQVPGLHLLVGGQDIGGLASARERLESLGTRVSLREGFLDMRETAQLFAATDTVALPYRQASQSGVLLLAYGFARPVVVYPSGGMVEAVIDGETGWICERPDVQSLTAALADSVRAGSEECLRRGRAGERLADERFAWPAIARRTAALYEQALAG
ncbi:MAG TPA: glycosyltransferase family 4 protein [Solirubrobacteraceae bacterium]|jgi:glycosyltransferase involved in cell wall biosynthesis|nr:glycosyltransferase family 4 protein [Solirubrobacteraceae bacterium]